MRPSLPVPLSPRPRPPASYSSSLPSAPGPMGHGVRLIVLEVITHRSKQRVVAGSLRRSDLHVL